MNWRNYGAKVSDTTCVFVTLFLISAWFYEDGMFDIPPYYPSRSETTHDASSPLLYHMIPFMVSAHVTFYFIVAVNWKRTRKLFQMDTRPRWMGVRYCFLGLLCAWFGGYTPYLYVWAVSNAATVHAYTTWEVVWRYLSPITQGVGILLSPVGGWAYAYVGVIFGLAYYLVRHWLIPVGPPQAVPESAVSAPE